MPATKSPAASSLLPSEKQKSNRSITPRTAPVSSPASNLSFRKDGNDGDLEQPLEVLMSSSYTSEESASHYSSPSRSKRGWKSKIMGHFNPERQQSSNPLANFFSRQKNKRQSPKKGEGSPLLPVNEDGNGSLASYRDTYQDPSLSYSMGSYDRELGLTFLPGQDDGTTSKKDYWKILKDRIQRGDLLLSGASSDHVQNRTQQTGNIADKHDLEIQEAIHEIRKGMEFNIWHGLMAIFVYLGISVACFNTIFEPEWSILDSIYFAMVTVTTVGYGDEVPTTEASMVFTCLYAMSGVAILGIALGVLGSNLVDAQEAMASTAEDLLRFQVLNVFDASSELRTREDVLAEDKRKDGEKKAETVQQPTLVRSLVACLKGFLPLVALMLGMAYWIGHRAGWTILEIIYFMIVTATTVGYGDFTPKSDEEKMIALLFIPIAVGAMGVWLGGVANIIVESRSAKYRRNMGMKELTQHDLDIMDQDGDGVVTRAEFLEFMLVAMNKVDQELVDELREHFNRLDADGTGELTKEDLIEVARKKLKSPVHKLRLSAYKERLLETARRSSGGVMSGWSSNFMSGLTFGNETTSSS